MKELFDKVSCKVSVITTKTYSTSFSLGIYCLDKKFHEPIYNIYGFVRFADEIVDSFHGYDKELLLREFKEETYKAIERKISLNPILNSFQSVVHAYNIEQDLVDGFLKSMEMDLSTSSHNKASYENYIYGSAEVVGLMCLRVFTENSEEKYQALKPFAMRLGSAFQKVNFLRDIQSDYKTLERVYFPGVDLDNFAISEKRNIEKEIEVDFAEALQGIKRLPSGSRFGVYVAYIYYKSLFDKIKDTPASLILNQRIRISNSEKIYLLCSSYFKNALRLL
ncbi:phytoene synthase [Sphingobacteriaceae bacterium]|nr:phytoene synthase [Sphingobacteriaceae bacterium]